MFYVIIKKSSEGSKKAWQTRKYGGSRSDLYKFKEDHDALRNKYKDLLDWSKQNSWERPGFPGSLETVKNFQSDVEKHSQNFSDTFGKNKTNKVIEEDLARAKTIPNVEGKFENVLSALFFIEDKMRWLNHYLPKEEKEWMGRERSEASWKKLMSKAIG